MPKIDTIEDLVRIIKEQPAWLDRIRGLILTEELMRLPSRVDGLSAQVKGLNTRVDGLNTRVDGLNTRVDGLSERVDTLSSDFGKFAEKTDKRLANLEEGQARLEGRQARLEGRQARLEEGQARLEGRQARLEEGQDVLTKRFDRLVDDVGNLKGNDALLLTERWYRLVAVDLGYSSADLVDVFELRQIARLPAVQDVGRDALRSFLGADLVIKAEGEDGDQHYIVVEVSYTVNGRDTRRAVRNAELLSRATGVGATAVVSGFTIDDAVREEIASGAARWFRLDSRELAPR